LGRLLKIILEPNFCDLSGIISKKCEPTDTKFATPINFMAKDTSVPILGAPSEEATPG